MKEKDIEPTSLNIYKHDDSYIKTLNRRQCIIWTYDDLAYRCIHKTPGRNVLKTTSRCHEDCHR